MKKDRNSFFTNYNAQSQSYIPNFQQPYQSSGLETFQYSGPTPMNQSTNIDLENRLNKIERQLNRLENRVSTLENQNIKTTPSDTNYQNMYMI